MHELLEIQHELDQIREERNQKQEQIKARTATTTTTPCQRMESNINPPSSPSSSHSLSFSSGIQYSLDRDIASLLKEDQTLTSDDIAYILDQPLGRIQPRVARIQREIQQDNDEEKAFSQLGMYGLSQRQASGVLVLG